MMGANCTPVFPKWTANYYLMNLTGDVGEEYIIAGYMLAKKQAI